MAGRVSANDRLERIAELLERSEADPEARPAERALPPSPIR
jgi:hypothetical protein